MLLNLILALFLGFHPVEPDTWISYGPRTYFTWVGRYVVEIFPPRYRLNMEGSKTLCYMYRYEERGDGTRKFTLLWKDSLLSYLPDRVFLTDDGYLITVDPEHFGGPFDHALVIYSPQGTVVRHFPLDTLLTRDSREIVHSVTARWWYRDARFFHLSGPSRFYLLLRSHKVMEFRLSDGRYTLGSAVNYPKLVEQSQRTYSNCEFHNHDYIELMFSSITEMMNERNSALK